VITKVYFVYNVSESHCLHLICLENIICYFAIVHKLFLFIPSMPKLKTLLFLVECLYIVSMTIKCSTKRTNIVFFSENGDSNNTLFLLVNLESQYGIV